MPSFQAVKGFLHNGSYLTFLGIMLVFIMSAANLALTLFYTWRNTRKTNFINTVTASRIKWIGSLRDKMSSFISTVIALKYMAPSDARAEEKRVELDALRYSIYLHLNPDTEPDKEIQALVLGWVRVTGQLMFDSEHFLRNHLDRVNNWEIHPVMKMEYCTTGASCTIGDDAGWKSIDDL
jgi:hypothetical protein